MKTLILDSKEIGKFITQIGVSGKKLDNDIQLASLSIINHVESCGNITLANRLITNMPKGSRVNAVISHMVKNGKMKFDDKTKKITYNKNGKTDLQGAKDLPWYTEKPEAPFNPASFDMAKYLKGQLDKNTEDLAREGLVIAQETKIKANIAEINKTAKSLGITLS